MLRNRVRKFVYRVKIPSIFPIAQVFVEFQGLMGYNLRMITKRPYRQHHLFCLLEAYDNQTLPLDLFISHYFRAHKALGPKDRGEIAETLYGMVRWQSLLDYFCDEPITWEKRYEAFSKLDLKQVFKHEEIPAHIRVSCPQNLFDYIAATHGMEKATELCCISNQPAPTTIRVNALKISRDTLFNQWKSKYNISVCRHSSDGIVFHKKINFFQLPEFKDGLFEVQDEGSQLLAQLVKAGVNDQVMDYCAGSGGKTLAFAPHMERSGQIYLHDIRKHALMESRKRLRRAGIQNAQVLEADSPALAKLKKKMNWILVDAPCSGSGTLRRNPDMKWKFTDEMLIRLVGQQRHIFEKALSYLRPDGRIVYGTCSILKEENQEQIAHFMKTYGLKLEGEVFQTLPSHQGMDGFFGAVLRR